MDIKVLMRRSGLNIEDAEKVAKLEKDLANILKMIEDLPMLEKVNKSENNVDFLEIVHDRGHQEAIFDDIMLNAKNTQNGSFKIG